MIITKTSKLDFGAYLFMILFLVLPFIQAATDLEQAERLATRVMSPFVSSFASYIRWAILGFLPLHYFFNRTKYHSGFSSFNLFIIFFYFIQLLYSLVDEDALRYFGLVSLAALMPLFVSVTLRRNHQNLVTKMQLIVCLFILGSIIFNITMITSGLRFHGFSVSSNSFGLTAVFWLMILLLPKPNEQQKINRIIVCFVIVAFITIILSGSRNALVGSLIVLLMHFKNNLKAIILPLVIVSFSVLYLANTFDISFITNRLLNIENSVADSGRSGIWEEVFMYIKQNPYWGNGMNAYKDLIDRGNTHSGYLRLILSMGFVFAVLSLMFYFLFVSRVLLTRKKSVPSALVGYILFFTVANIAEDLFFGTGSPSLMYFFISVGLFGYYFENERTIVYDSLDVKNKGIDCSVEK